MPEIHQLADADTNDKARSRRSRNPPGCMRGAARERLRETWERDHPRGTLRCFQPAEDLSLLRREALGREMLVRLSDRVDPHRLQPA
jgi:hypothetical protein